MYAVLWCDVGDLLAPTGKSTRSMNSKTQLDIGRPKVYQKLTDSESVPGGMVLFHGPHRISVQTAQINRPDGLQARPEFEQVVSRLSNTFINLPADRVDGEVNNGLASLAEVLDLDGTLITQTDVDKKSRIFTHSWRRPGLPAAPTGRTDEVFPWLASRIAGMEICKWSAIEDVPEEAVAERAYMLSVGLKSWLTVPLVVGGDQIGGMIATMFRWERTWDDLVLSRFQRAAEVFANALARKRINEELQNAYAEIEQLKQRLSRETRYLKEEAKLQYQYPEIVGGSDAIHRVLKKAEQVAKTDATVLLRGETGTGKELIARAIHEFSKRNNRPMVTVNCAALPATLIESELFGREKGAFTGALTREIGRFELANGSTLFLDEIGELPLDLQAKLLRVLQDGEFERLGSPRTIHVDVRVIAATARDLESAMKQGKFREDLFYRLSVFPITIPPLRERREDIPMLVWHFVTELGQRMGRQVAAIHGPTMEAFKNYSWPGNIRELRNVVERFMITHTGTTLFGDWESIETSTASGSSETLEDMERKHITNILKRTRWQIRGEAGAAVILGMKPTTLESLMRKLDITRPARPGDAIGTGGIDGGNSIPRF